MKKLTDKEQLVLLKKVVKAQAKALKLHEKLLKQLLGVRKSI